MTTQEQGLLVDAFSCLLEVARDSETENRAERFATMARILRDIRPVDDLKMKCIATSMTCDAQEWSDRFAKEDGKTVLSTDDETGLLVDAFSLLLEEQENYLEDVDVHRIDENFSETCEDRAVMFDTMSTVCQRMTTYTDQAIEYAEKATELSRRFREVK
jgi:hypothetical protein